MSLTDRILSRARELGFDHAGVAPAEPLPHGDAFRDWLDLSMHGEMSWMERTRDLRDQPKALLPEARSVIAVALNYKRPDDGSEDDARGRIASYAHGYDYHRVLEYKLSSLAAFIEAETGRAPSSRAAVDRLPILERDVAYLAGIGWYGKNTMILQRQLGSWLFLGELVVDLDLEVNTQLPRDFCGSCTACLDACPTGAFVAPHVLDARRCISYLTIELRGPIPRELRRAVGAHLFGCDICQRVCPWNHKAPEVREFAFLGRPEILSLAADELLTMDERTFRLRLAMSPVQRPKRKGLLRNAAVVLGNSKNRRWIPLLAQRLNEEPEALVRGHLAWALGELGSKAARDALERRLAHENEIYVIEEIRQALSTC